VAIRPVRTSNAFCGSSDYGCAARLVCDEFHLADTAQNFRKLARLVQGPRAIPSF